MDGFSPQTSHAGKDSSSMEPSPLAKSENSDANTYQIVDRFPPDIDNTLRKKQEGKEMATMMMEQMERITPSSTSWITIDERAAQLKRRLASPAPGAQDPAELSAPGSRLLRLLLPDRPTSASLESTPPNPPALPEGTPGACFPQGAFLLYAAIWKTVTGGAFSR